MNRSLTDREFFTPRPGAQDIYKLIPHAAARQRKASRGVFAKATLASQVSNGDGINEARAACGTDSGFKIKPSGFILKLLSIISFPIILCNTDNNCAILDGRAKMSC